MSHPDRLSPHFTFAEMTRTDVRRLLDTNRDVPDELIPVGVALCETLLEPIRDHFGAPVIVHSGYRCKELNTVVGGSKTSQHMKFAASDFHVVGVELVDVWKWVWQSSGLRWGQLLLEGWSFDKPSWIHISLGAPWRDPVKCGQVMTYDSSKKRYELVATVT
jgi:zinc D-Ala-D-Ala carboxypeptidase